MYPADFPNDPPPLIDPTLLVALILAMIVLMIVAFASGRQLGRRSRMGNTDEVARTIHRAILRKAREAAAAPTGRVIEAANELQHEVLRRMGPVIALGAPMGLNFKGLMDALKGEPEKPKDKHGDHGKGGHDKGHGGHGDGHGDGHDDEDDNLLERGGLSLVDTTLLAPTINIRTKGPIILAASASDKKTRKGDDHGHDEPKEPTYEEQVWRVRKAITAFADHWSRGETVGDIQRAQKALMETPDLPKDFPGEL